MYNSIINTSSVYCIVRYKVKAKVKSPSITIYPHSSLFCLPPPTFPLGITVLLSVSMRFYFSFLIPLHFLYFLTKMGFFILVFPEIKLLRNTMGNTVLIGLYQKVEVRWGIKKNPYLFFWIWHWFSLGKQLPFSVISSCLVVSLP